jgi:hypothetical protein
VGVEAGSWSRQSSLRLRPEGGKCALWRVCVRVVAMFVPALCNQSVTRETDFGAFVAVEEYMWEERIRKCEKGRGNGRDTAVIL